MKLHANAATCRASRPTRSWSRPCPRACRAGSSAASSRRRRRAPIAFGLYLAPWIDDIAPGSAQDFMYFVGATEIVAGVLVALKPRYGAYVVAAWLAGIILNLLTHSGYYDIALRDFGLMLAAPPLRLGRR